MNRFLYKYMPIRPDFFIEPMLRATQSYSLNDPFEGRFNNRQVLDANNNHTEYFSKRGHQIDQRSEFELEGVSADIQRDLSELGILSFTEDYNNPLMWAHYADEHKGVVVEFDFDKPFFPCSSKTLNGKKSRFGHDYFGEVYEFPEKVNYRRDMPAFERPELANPADEGEFHWKKFTKSILFTKANDWIYEKEQRSVVRLRDADSIICVGSKYITEVCAKDSSISLNALNDGKVKITFPPGNEMQEDMGDESLKNEIFRLSYVDGNNSIYLFRVNLDAISGVYFGCKSDYQEALQEIKRNTTLSQLKNINKMDLNEFTYSINPRKVG